MPRANYSHERMVKVMRNRQLVCVTIVITHIVFAAIVVILASSLHMQQLDPTVQLKPFTSWRHVESSEGLRTLPVGMIVYSRVSAHEAELDRHVVQQRMDVLTRLWPDKEGLLLRHLYHFPDAQ
ncbi:hypothetical protein [Paenibacillus sp. UMB4589-SE434]|uniref:hypothetical protein n=2 Tax=unclassified Paenibacillus TaxID=185978 RepID=UPI002551811D|nr:hypothetical protein [Paenibacillus sp. UMB4589-SE434]MDK8182832.1 hypothetical protein [Paenibacillus sp. UMB4589-SE434]